MDEETITSTPSRASPDVGSLGCVVFLVAGHEKYGEQLGMTLYYTAKNLLAVHRPPPSDEPVAAPASTKEVEATNDLLSSVATVRRELRRLQQVAAEVTTDIRRHHTRAASALGRADVAIAEAIGELELFLNAGRHNTHPVHSENKGDSSRAKTLTPTYAVLVFHDHHLNQTQMERLRQSARAGLVAGHFHYSCLHLERVALQSTNDTSRFYRCANL